MAHSTKTVLIVIIIVIAVIVAALLIRMIYKNLIIGQIEDGGDMRNPDYLQIEDEISEAIGNADEISYSWSAGDVNESVVFTVRKENGKVLYSCEPNNFDAEEVTDWEIDESYFNEAKELLKENLVSFTSSTFIERHMSDSSEEPEVLDASSYSLSFTSGGQRYVFSEEGSSDGTPEIFLKIAEETGGQ